MTPMTAFVIIVGLPLVLVSIGFLLLMLRLFRGRDKERDALRVLEAVQSLERTLGRMEGRLADLEDIVLKPSDKGREANDE